METIHYAFGDLDESLAKSLIQAVDEGCRKIVLCSDGGSVMSALAVYDRLILLPDISIEATGSCMSAAMIVYLAAARRTATPSTRFMLHSVRLRMDDHLVHPGDCEMAELDTLQSLMVSIVRDRAGVKAAELSSNRANTYFGVAEGRELGIVTAA